MSFSGIAQRSLALRPAHLRRHLYVTCYTEGSSHFVTSMTAPVASGWSGCRVGLAPTGKRRLFTAHTRTGRLWTYVRDDRPFGGPDPPAVSFFYAPDRSAKHPEQHLASYAGLMQADAYAGFHRLYDASRKPAPITEVACWSHARHNFFDLVRLAKAPIAIEAVKRIDELFAIERESNGLPTQERL